MLHTSELSVGNAISLIALSSVASLSLSIISGFLEQMLISSLFAGKKDSVWSNGTYNLDLMFFCCQALCRQLFIPERCFTA